MSKRRLRNAGSRPKALFGAAEASAILAAAGINVAGTMAASAINASATKKAAQDQAKATIQAAQRQSQAIKDQTAKSREYQQEAQEFTREENAENRELQRDIQMQLQMLTGQQNVNDRLEAAKIKVKAGGSTRRRLRSAGGTQFLLRGGNMPFQVTDGGAVIPVGITPEGYDLYEILGNDHEHYHKTRGGKYKSGVGIKFADGNVVEGEGNQKKNGGELMLVTPDNAYFISKHSINGFNPAEGVKQGLHPLQAYAIQEQEKDMIGINDDGTKKAKFGKRRFLIGGTPNLYDYANMGYPQVGTDTIGDTAVGVAYGVQNPTEKRTLKCGGKVRHKAYWGTDAQGRRIWISGSSSTSTYSGPGNSGRNSYYGQTTGGNASSSTTPRSSNGGPGTGGRTGVGVYGGGGNDPGQKPNTNSNTSAGRASTRGGFGSWVNNNADLLGAGLNALGNIGGAWITSSANRSAARTLADAYGRGADIMAEAYRSLKTIDTDNLRREDYAAAHMMPALQAPVSFAENQVAGVNRSLQRRLRNAGRYSMSSAAAQDRMANAEIEAQDKRNRVYSTDQQQMQQIRQANAERVSEASKINAMLDTQARQQYGQDYLKLLQYNNDIENTKILGSAGALSEGAINGANAISQGQTSSAQAWATALGNSGLTFSNTLSTMAKRRADFENTMLGATTDAQINQIARNGSRREKEARLEAVRAAIKSGKLSSEDEAKYRYYESLLSKSV